MPLGRLRDVLTCWSHRHEEEECRTVYVLHQHITDDVAIKNKQYPNNVVVSSKYTAWNFIPKNLFEQFRRIANFYFLCIGAVQLIIDSPVSPMTSILPLIFVVSVTAIKQGYEDWQRHQADKEVNNRVFRVVKNGKLVNSDSKHIEVGDVVQVNTEEEFPCDLVLLSSSEDDGTCYVTTANLDGETNLKVHSSLPDTLSLQTGEQISDLIATVECQHPDVDLYRYTGRLKIYSHGNTQPEVRSLGPTQLLLRGAKLKNTPTIMGVAVYTGKDTKMALNQQESAHKFSRVEKSMNTFLLIYLGLLLLQGILCTSLKHGKYSSSNFPYVQSESGGALKVLEDFLAFLVLFNYVIPISMYVTIELMKFIGAQFFNWDVEMYNHETDEPAKANTSDLNEELGQVEYLFSDKTGTLTENDMQFRLCSINGIKYEETDKQLQLEGRENQPVILSAKLDPDIVEFFKTLALCHTIQASKETDPDAAYEYHYQASSPDEKAFVEVAARFGIIFKGSIGDELILQVHDTIERFKLLHVLEFDSTRKRMSVILQDQDDKYILLCKGAETAILNRVACGPTEETLEHIDQYAKKGLRTLAIASKYLSDFEFNEIDDKMRHAKQAINDREEQLERVFDEIENDLRLLGATAVEDRLQDGVKQTLESLRDAGIKVWVLTGDKQETAVNISYSCGHFKFEGQTILYVVKQKSSKDCETLLLDYKKKLEHEVNKDIPNKEMFALVIDGASLAMVFVDNKDLFIEVCKNCSAVLCCRMSPLQKAQVVNLMKWSAERPITAAIGDGANDCSMIQEAHVGIGVMGKEGRQAVRCSDYAISKFKFLMRVLLVHGHWFYIRISTLVQYFFYKNVAFIFPQFYYSFVNGFSQQTLYSSIHLTMYNIFFTSLPIFIYGLFEQNLSAETLLAQPSLYKDIAKNAKLSWAQFIYWNLSGVWHSLVFFLSSLFVFSEDGILGGDAMVYGNWAFGVFVYTLVIVVCNIKLGLVTCYWILMTHVAIWGSILFYFGFMILAGNFTWSGIQETFFDGLSLDLYKVFPSVLSYATVWLAIIVLTLIALIPDVAAYLIGRHVFTSRIQQAQMQRQTDQDAVQLLSKVPITTDSRLDNLETRSRRSHTRDEESIFLECQSTASTTNLLNYNHTETHTM